MNTQQIKDSFGRIHDYVRISVTDRCNLRCVYCMPEEGLPFFPHDKVLSGQEIIELAKVFAELGISKIRLTGGEPLLRKDIVEIISGIHKIPGIQDISLTTNGLYLHKRAEELKAAGLNRVNISLDTFDKERYQTITRGGQITQVLKGIKAAAAAELTPIKLNVVLIKGQNDDEILEFVRFSESHPVNIRFIEFMPVGKGQTAWNSSYLELQEVFERCKEAGISYRPVSLEGNGPSKNYQVAGGVGTFGLIHPVSCQFCDSCNRLRVTADGYLKSCLYWDEEVNIRPLISNPRKLQDCILESLTNKPKNHEMALSENQTGNARPTWRHMSQIGG